MHSITKRPPNMEFQKPTPEDSTYWLLRLKAISTLFYGKKFFIFALL